MGSGNASNWRYAAGPTGVSAFRSAGRHSRRSRDHSGRMVPGGWPRSRHRNKSVDHGYLSLTNAPGGRSRPPGCVRSVRATACRWRFLQKHKSCSVAGTSWPAADVRSKSKARWGARALVALISELLQSSAAEFLHRDKSKSTGSSKKRLEHSCRRGITSIQIHVL